jgi:uncharacterized protein (PEP-CTERM system associated)
MVPGEIQAYRPPDNFTRRTPEPYVNKEFRSSITLMGLRTSLELHLHDTERNYILSNGKETVRGVDFVGRRNLSPSSTLILRATYEKVHFASEGDGRDLLGTLSFNRVWGRTIDTTLEYSHIARSGFTEYDANFVTLLVNKRFF